MHRYYEKYLYDELGKQNPDLFSYVSTPLWNYQKKGIDVMIARYEGRYIYVDEKTAFTWCNTGLDTFFLELSFINRYNERMKGWLLNDSLLTDVYAFAWLDLVDTEKAGYITNRNKYLVVKSYFDEANGILKILFREKNTDKTKWVRIGFDDIANVEIYFCPKKSILNFCRRNGLTDEEMEFVSNPTNIERCRAKGWAKHLFPVVISRAEKSVGIKIKKNDLFELSMKAYRIKDGKLINLHTSSTGIWG